MTHVNLTAYEGVEALGRFGREEFRRYCEQKLQSCDKYLAFIRKHFPNRPLRVLEIGCGNGKLLFRLELEGMLEVGIGYEVSQSRCRFADAFGAEYKSTRVTVVNADFVHAPPSQGQLDLVIGIDVVGNLIAAISPQHTSDLLDTIRESLAPTGAGVLELMTCERELEFINRSPDGVYRTWKEFEPHDPFRFGLDELWLDYDKNLVWSKQFISRGNEISSFSNILKPFAPEDFRRAVEAAGMECRITPSWTEGDDTADEEYIALFSRPGEL